MNDRERIDPDALLHAVQREVDTSSRGRLRLFFGMAPGVGKTYAMLEAAQEKAREGADVVIGCVETHGREETNLLLAGLSVIPKRTLAYRETAIFELDVDAILARRPGIVLVDELAHTNAPGSRHEKRWQDVEELLTSGIDVYSTLNVQHLESCSEAIREITGVTVRERVPDGFLDGVEVIEVVDLAPEDLLRRLAEGKVYHGDMAERAAARFFRMENLIALREMALRITADRVDRQLRQFVRVNSMEGAWKAAHRLLVAVGPSPHSASLIRWTRSLASALEATWMAVSVLPMHGRDDQDASGIEKYLSLARALGAETIVMSDEDVVSGILHVARQQHITQIVIGKAPASLWDRITGGSFVDRLIRESGTIDVHTVRVDDSPPAKTGVRRGLRLTSRPEEYLVALSAVMLIPLLGYVLFPQMGHLSVALLQLMVVFGLAVFLGRGPIITAAAAGAVIWEFFFLPPFLSVYISRTEDVLIFLLFLLAAAVMGTLTARIRAQERAARLREDRIASFYSFLKEAAEAADDLDVARKSMALLGTLFSAEVTILLAGDRDALHETPGGNLILTDKEYAIAEWSFRNRKPAGRGTGTLQSTRVAFTPLLAPGGPLGVVGLRRSDNRRLLLDEKQYYESFLGQIAAGIERKRLEARVRSAFFAEESQRLQKTMLNSISHELRTPLSAIISAATALSEDIVSPDPLFRSGMAVEILSAAERLNQVVENLLDISRIESGRLVLTPEWTDVADIIGAALRRFRTRSEAESLKVDIRGQLPLLRIDAALIEQALVNVLNNALAYAPRGTPISIRAEADGASSSVRITVLAQGPGFAEETLPHLFKKFYRVPGTAAGGIGLGLSIAKGFLEAHYGKITAENAPGGGACLTLTLPIMETPSVAPE